MSFASSTVSNTSPIQRTALVSYSSDDSDESRYWETELLTDQWVMANVSVTWEVLD